jgi:cell division protein FtsB
MARFARTSSPVADGQPVLSRRPPRRFWPHVALFAATVLLVNGLFGERGLMDTIRANRVAGAAARDLDQLKRVNAALREQASRLRSDPAPIESVAREDLGLVRRGEILVTVKHVK